MFSIFLLRTVFVFQTKNPVSLLRGRRRRNCYFIMLLKRDNLLAESRPWEVLITGSLATKA
jgi:hypothetical protein